MSVSRAFDLAQWLNEPVNVGDGVVVSALGPPFQGQFKPGVVSSNPGVVVGSSVPAATAQDQILVSGPSPNFSWALGVNPAVAATVPPATATNQLIMSNASEVWSVTDIVTVLTLGGAYTLDCGTF